MELEWLEIPCDGATATGHGAPGAGGPGMRAAEFPAMGMTTEHSLWKELPVLELGLCPQSTRGPRLHGVGIPWLGATC